MAYDKAGKGGRVMPAWVSSALRPPPRDRTVFVRFGGDMFDAGWSHYFQRWFWLYPGGGRKEIADPPLWFDVTAPDITDEEKYGLVFGQEVTSAKPPHGPQQLGFNLEVSDSGMLSQGHGEARNPTGRLV